MRTTASGRMLLSVLVALAVTAAHHAAAVGPPKPRGQETHLFEATVRVPDNGAAGDLEEYNYRLLANVLGSVEAARSAMYESELGLFSAFITNNQARRLSKVPGVLKVTRLEDPPALPETDGHL
uniref:Inhibitor I9 domain-containing protein n=1 Tax=Zea mays TaxID=4577 RepID=A0A804RIF3_MAIZE